MSLELNVFAGDISNLKDRDYSLPMKGYFGKDRARFYNAIKSDKCDFTVSKFVNGVATTDIAIAKNQLDSPVFFATTDSNADGEHDPRIQYAVVDLRIGREVMPEIEGMIALDVHVFDGAGGTVEEQRKTMRNIFNIAMEQDNYCSARFLGNPHIYGLDGLSEDGTKASIRFKSNFAGELPTNDFVLVLMPSMYGPSLEIHRRAWAESMAWSPSKHMLTNKYQKFLDDQEQVVADMADIFTNHKYARCELVSQPEAIDKNYLMQLTTGENVFVSTNGGKYIFQRGKLIDNFARRVFK